MTTARHLPVLDLVAPAGPPAGPRRAAAAADTRVAEFRPEDQALPRFWIWTLGCQMNKSDSEEMAGRLLAAGCAEATAMEAADLIVINTCAIREAAEAKVIGRQGALAVLKADPVALSHGTAGQDHADYNRIYRNTFYHNGHQESDPGFQGGIYFANWSGQSPVGNIVKGNVFFDTKNGAITYEGVVNPQVVEDNWDQNSIDPKFVDPSGSDPNNPNLPDLHLQAITF